MPSILTDNPLPPTGTQTTQGNSDDTAKSVKNVIDQILGSPNPQAVFNQILEQYPAAKNAMQLINQYGNGDPQKAFMAYSAQGRQSLGQSIITNFLGKFGIK